MTKSLTDCEMMNLAWNNVEKHLGDICLDAGTNDDIVYDEAYILAFDALADVGIDHEIARGIAINVAQRFAQP